MHVVYVSLLSKIDQKMMRCMHAVRPMAVTVSINLQTVEQKCDLAFDVDVDKMILSITQCRRAGRT